MADRIGAVPGVKRTVVDRSFYAQAFRDGRPVVDEMAEGAGHGWSSTLLAPYRLISGTALDRSTALSRS
ncbi:MAG TPA: hypothetical protein VNV66_09750 [Pilimelia sp.]|nr:hypothetical protein [Pilimelia sp.]